MQGFNKRAVMMGVLLLCSASAHSLDTGFYAGLSIGRAEQDLDAGVESSPGGELIYATTIDAKDTAYGLFGGYQFGRWFAVEGAFNHFGKSTTDFFFRYQDAVSSIESEGSSNMKANAFSLTGLLTIPLGDSFSFGLRAGVGYSDLDFESVSSVRFDGGQTSVGRGSDSKSNTAPVFGANVEYAMTPQVSLRADWQRFNDVGEGLIYGFEEFDIDLVTLSIVGRF